MNMRAQSAAENMAKSYLDWWREAGVDVATSPELHNWMQELPKAFGMPMDETPKAAIVSTTPMPVPNAAQKVSIPEESDKRDWPADMASLITAIQDKLPLPGNHYGGKTATPSLCLSPQILLIGDIPEIQDVENGKMPSGPLSELIRRMMQAIGVAAESYCFTALATTRPATGALPDGDLPMLGQFMEHQIGLIKPEKVIIFGSAACQALLGADVMDKRGNLHYFNHNVHKVAAVTTFHPRTLLARPQMKGQAWRDLQVLMK
jgi:uracil-DNA glycosylase